MFTWRGLTLTWGFTCCLSLGNMLSAQAFQVGNPVGITSLTSFGDVLVLGNEIYLSTNGLHEEDSGLDNVVGNAYNFSGKPAIAAEDVEDGLGLKRGQLSPNLNFVQATEASAVILEISVPEQSIYSLNLKFLTNDQTFTLDKFVIDDYAFEVIDGKFSPIANTNRAENRLIPSNTILPTTNRTFSWEVLIDTIDLDPGKKIFKFGVTDVMDTANSSGLQIEIQNVSNQPVPEPVNILGIGTALGFGAFLKRKMA